VKSEAMRNLKIEAYGSKLVWLSIAWDTTIGVACIAVSIAINANIKMSGLGLFFGVMVTYFVLSYALQMLRIDSERYMTRHIKTKLSASGDLLIRGNFNETWLRSWRELQAIKIEGDRLILSIVDSKSKKEMQASVDTNFFHNGTLHQAYINIVESLELSERVKKLEDKNTLISVLKLPEQVLTIEQKMTRLKIGGIAMFIYAVIIFLWLANRN
jgi:hypothetical protein